MKMARGLATFPKGGVHVQDFKLSADRPIEKLPLPKTVTIPLSQHTGAMSKPVVKPGDKIKVGQVIGESNGFVSVNTHATASGTVTKIENLMDVSGYRRPAVFIDVEGDEWIDGVDLTDKLMTEIRLNPGEIIKKVQADGIAGLGGATFPLHVKLSIPKGKKAEYLIINGVECEPFLTADHRLMLEKGEETIMGVKILMHALQVQKAIVGIERNKADVIRDWERYLGKNAEIEIVPLEVKYPQGAEKQLIEALTGRQVPIGGLPIDVGCVVQNVGTAFAVYESIQKNKPLVERVVTVTGKRVRKPSNLLVRFGVPIIHLIDAAGGLPSDTGKIISGGPMMGKALNKTVIPVTKGTSGVLLVPEAETPRKEVLHCIRCAKCSQYCPLGLEPYLLMNLISNDLLDEAEKEVVLNCCECGTCSYICPANRPLLDYIRLGKSTIMQRNKKS